MKGRPLCVASVLLAAIIFFGNAFFSSEEDKETVYESMQLICQVEQIQGLKNSQTLVVCDVMKGDRLFCKRMKVYESFGKSLFTGLKIGQIISLDGTVSSFSKPRAASSKDRPLAHGGAAISESFDRNGPVESSFKRIPPIRVSSKTPRR